MLGKTYASIPLQNQKETFSIFVSKVYRSWLSKILSPLPQHINIHSFLKNLRDSTNKKKDGAKYGDYSEKRAGPYIN